MQVRGMHTPWDGALMRQCGCSSGLAHASCRVALLDVLYQVLTSLSLSCTSAGEGVECTRGRSAGGELLRLPILQAASLHAVRTPQGLLLLTAGDWRQL